MDDSFNPSNLGKLNRLLPRRIHKFAEARRIMHEFSKNKVINASKTARLMYMIRNNLNEKQQELLDRTSILMDEVFTAGHPTDPRRPSLWIRGDGTVDAVAMLNDQVMIERELEKNPEVMEAYKIQLELINALGNDYRNATSEIGMKTSEFQNPYFFPRFGTDSNNSIKRRKGAGLLKQAAFEKFRIGGEERVTFDWHENMSRHINTILNKTSYARSVKELIEEYGKEVRWDTKINKPKIM